MEHTWIISNVNNMDISICYTYIWIANVSVSTYLETNNRTILGDVPSIGIFGGNSWQSLGKKYSRMTGI